MIVVKDLTFAYNRHQPLFEGFNLQVDYGESWAVIGPSGCGKTTLLYLLAGLLKTDIGSIHIAGRSISRPRPQTGLILQDHGLLPWATVQENTRLGLMIRKFYGPDGKHAPANDRKNNKDGKSRVDYWLKRLGINDLKDKYPSQLSRGQRQRTAIARTLVLSPDLLLMDEPFSALDVGIRYDLHKTMIELNNEWHLTSILVTHDIEEAVFTGEKILVLKGDTNRETSVFENDIAGKSDYRDLAQFPVLCEKLRALLGRC